MFAIMPPSTNLVQTFTDPAWNSEGLEGSQMRSGSDRSTGAIERCPEIKQSMSMKPIINLYGRSTEFHFNIVQHTV